jgi:hypothetical protein
MKNKTIPITMGKKKNTIPIRRPIRKASIIFIRKGTLVTDKEINQI